LYDLLHGRQLHSFAGHDSSVTGLVFTPDSRRLLSASHDTTVLVWDVQPWLSRRSASSAVVTAAALETAWRDLGSDKAALAFYALALLVDGSPASVPFLRERVRPAPPTDAKYLSKLLTDLGSDRFAERERAKKELERLADRAEPALERFLQRDLPLEARRRAADILTQVQGPIVDAERLRSLRAVEALEHIGTPDARRLLDALTRGNPDALLTLEARQALSRLKKLRRGGSPDNAH
jgi:hypothetical protein